MSEPSSKLSPGDRVKSDGQKFGLAWTSKDGPKLGHQLRASAEQAHKEKESPQSVYLYLMTTMDECSYGRVEVDANDEKKLGFPETVRWCIYSLVDGVIKAAFPIVCCACGKSLLGRGSYQTGSMRIIKRHAFAVIACVGSKECCVKVDSRLSLILSSFSAPDIASAPAYGPIAPKQEEEEKKVVD